MAKIWTIIKSRFQQQIEEEWVKTRRGICLGCKYNSLNTQRTSFTHDFLASLSYFFSWLFNRADKDHKSGVCTICHCPIELKIRELDVEYTCEHPEGNQWEKSENGIRLNIYKQRKNGNNKKTNR